MRQRKSSLDNRKISSQGPPKGASEPGLVVGIGASVGGLEAFSAFFEHMPTDSGMAFVLIQHLAPDHASILTVLVGKSTAMTVVEAEDGMPIEPNRVFVIPPNATLTMAEGKLRVATPAPARDKRRPIDTFMFSLAEDQGENAVCIILSGSGSDGAQGLAAIKEHGGITLAQAQFDETAMSGMPRSAAATGLVDHVLAVEAMPAKLAEYQRHLSHVRECKGSDGTREDAKAYLDEVCALLGRGIGHDFRQYKEGTLIRRIQRRMQIRNLGAVSDYIAYLRREPHEVELLFRDLLIGVTHFFRNPEAFEALAASVIAPLLKDKRTEDQIRVWVPGCATGEEAYSIAILLREVADQAQVAPKFVIFCTDINETAIAIARSGRYHKSRLDGLSPKRVADWFIEDGEYYCPIKEIREMCVFSVHSVIKDPPFSRLALISCRNLLIYMDTGAQDRIIPLFHYALQPGGHLFLGPSESVTRHGDFFLVFDKKHRLFRRNDDVSSSLPSFARIDAAVAAHGGPRAAPSATGPEQIFDRGARRVMDRYSPAYLVVDRQYQILKFSGQTGKYLEPSEGAPSFNLFSLVQNALRPTLRTALREAVSTQRRVMQRSVPIEVDGKGQAINLIVEPIPQVSGTAKHYVVAFHDLASIGDDGSGPAIEAGDLGSRELRNELHATKARLQAAIDEAERANEELRSANEEYRSANEEIQSSNEELEASKEELQSLNEELQTLNSELWRKNELLGVINSDLQNFLDGSQIAMLFLNRGLSIRNFTPAATDIFRLRDADRGRPITDIASRLGYATLKEDVHECLRELTVVEREVHVVENDTDFVLRIRPYRTTAGNIDGVVLTFVDISERKRHEAVRAQLAAIVESSRDAVISQTLDGAITSWNTGAEQMFGYTANEAVGQPIALLVPKDRQDEVPGLINRIEKGERIEHFETVRVTKDGKLIGVSVVISPICDASGRIVGASGVLRDVTDRQHAEKHRGLLMAELDHRVKNTLATVQSIVMQTTQRATSIEDFRRGFNDRLMSLAQTHSLLTEGHWKGASLRRILTAELSPYGGGDGHQRFKISGEDVSLTAKQALALGLGFHELATNAAKHGALSAPGGRVDVSLDISAADGGPILQIRWIESGGPAVEEPRTRGFGSRLIERGLQNELDADIHFDFRPDGVRCSMRIPLSPDS